VSVTGFVHSGKEEDYTNGHPKGNEKGDEKGHEMGDGKVGMNDNGKENGGIIAPTPVHPTVHAVHAVHPVHPADKRTMGLGLGLGLGKVTSMNPMPSMQAMHNWKIFPLGSFIASRPVTPSYYSSGKQGSGGQPGSNRQPGSSRSNNSHGPGYSGYSGRSFGFGPGHISASRSRSRSRLTSSKAKGILDNSDSRSRGYSQEAAIGPTESQPVSAPISRRPSTTVSTATPAGREPTAAAQ
jgi:hypothetical protein